MTSMASPVHPSWFRARGSIPTAAVDAALARVARSKLEAAVQAVAMNKSLGYRAPQRALEALAAPGSSGSFRTVEDMLDTHGLELGPHLGAGMESLVFAADPRGGADWFSPGRHVLKLSVPVSRPHGAPFQTAVDIPGVAPLWAKEEFGHLHAALQPRAQAVRPKELGPRAMPDDSYQWEEIAERLRESLRQRGHFWSDGIPQNMGLMEDGNWSVIDGTVEPYPAGGEPPSMSTEDAIRLLRLTPEDDQLLRRTVPLYGQPR